MQGTDFHSTAFLGRGSFSREGWGVLGSCQSDASCARGCLVEMAVDTMTVAVCRRSFEQGGRAGYRASSERSAPANLNRFVTSRRPIDAAAAPP